MESADARLRREPDEPRRVPEPRQRPERGFRGGGSAALGGRVAGGGTRRYARRGEGRRGRSSDERLRSVSDGRRRCLRRRVRVADAVGGARVHGRLARVRGGRVRARAPFGADPMGASRCATLLSQRANANEASDEGTEFEASEPASEVGSNANASSSSGGGGSAASSGSGGGGRAPPPRPPREGRRARSQTTGPRGGRRPAGAR